MFSCIIAKNIDNSYPLTKYGNKMDDFKVFEDISYNNFIFPDFDSFSGISLTFTSKYFTLTFPGEWLPW